MDPEKARDQERLRPDLYFALTTLVIRLRPLRERLDEILLLAQHFLERTNLRRAGRVVGFEDAASEALVAYDWPGNLRELARVIEVAHERAIGDLIRLDDIPPAIRGNLGAAYIPPPIPPLVTPLDDLLTKLERRLIEQALGRARQNKSRAAELLDISRPRLYRRIKELNIPDEPEPPETAAANGPAQLVESKAGSVVPGMSSGPSGDGRA
jgi:DNA-binding NtrC family response regulator